MIAASTAPKEKNTDSAVTRYCFPLGMCSKSSVPSVGIEPFTSWVQTTLGEYHGMSVSAVTYPNGAAEKEEREA